MADVLLYRNFLQKVFPCSILPWHKKATIFEIFMDLQNQNDGTFAKTALNYETALNCLLLSLESFVPASNFALQTCKPKILFVCSRGSPCGRAKMEPLVLLVCVCVFFLPFFIVTFFPFFIVTFVRFEANPCDQASSGPCFAGISAGFGSWSPKTPLSGP